MFKFIAVFALLVVTLWGCKKDMNKTGYDLLLPGDLVSARKISVQKASIKAYTVTDALVKTSNPEVSLLGTINDPIFGKTTADFANQFHLADYHEFNNNAKPDSLVLSFLYMETYGDKVTPQTLKVYELNQDLNPEATYYQNIDLKSKSNSEVLAEKTFIPKFKLDSLTSHYGSTKKVPRDTVLQKINFRLPLLADKLIKFKAPPFDPKGDNNVNDAFIKYFKGLYVEAGDLNQGGGIVKIFPSRQDPKDLMLVHRTEMKLYYHKENDTIKYVQTYDINSRVARVSRYEHNYTTTRFADNLNKLDQQDSLIYLQTTGGLSNKIYIPSLNNWRDSTDCAINKAELIFQVDKSTIFQVDKSTIDTIKYPVPHKIILSLIDKDGKIFSDDAKQQLIFPTDLTLSQAYYGGTYNVKEGTYRFNLAKHLQEIIKRTKGKDINYGFYLSTDEKNAIFRRLVLKGATSKVGIRFEITYSKVKESPVSITLN